MKKHGVDHIKMHRRIDLEFGIDQRRRLSGCFVGKLAGLSGGPIDPRRKEIEAINRR